MNEVQHKLWKIFFEKSEKEDASAKKNAKPAAAEPAKAPKPAENVDTVEVDDPDDEEIDLETKYEEWLRDTRKRGFKHTSPSNAAEYNRVHKERVDERGRKQNRSEDKSNGNESSGQEQVKYCHFWNNKGKCNYENCLFVHQSAPVCKFDGECRRQKCMFSHIKQNMHFLSNKTDQIRPPVMNPWHSTIPQWSNPFHFQPGPWQSPDMGRRNKH